MATPVPDPSPNAATSSPPRAGLAVLGLLLAALIACFHLASGSARAEIGSHPDEAAHFVTGLMMRDYIAGGFRGSPMRYATEYYQHYPKIGLGNWPPVFYMLQAAGMLLLPATVGTVLWEMCAVTLALGLALAWWLWREYGWETGVTGAVLLTGLPLIQQYSNMVMSEVLVALLMLAAVGFFARYLDRAGWRDAAGFGICAGLAIMTKGTGLALAFVPPLAILFTRRYSLLKRPSLWVAALLVAVIAGPWTWLFRKQANAGWLEPHPSLHFTGLAVGYYLWQMTVAMGGLLALLALAGAVTVLLSKGKEPAILVCSLALVLGVWTFQCLLPVGLEARHLTPAMPALIILAMRGLLGLTNWCGGRMRALIQAGLLAIFFGWPAVFHPPMPEPGYGSLGTHLAVSPFRIPRKEWSGFQAVAEAPGLILGTGPRQSILVASDARGEGMFIADVALKDPHRPSYTVERASKLMASSTWSGAGYASLYSTPAEALAMLDHSGIEAVVLDLSPGKIEPHEQLLLQAISAAGSGFAPLGKWPVTRDGHITPDALEVFQRPANR